MTPIDRVDDYICNEGVLRGIKWLNIPMTFNDLLLKCVVKIVKRKQSLVVVV